MKKLVLGTMIAAAAAGCVSSTEEGHMAASWSLQSVSGTGQLSPTVCPAGFDTAALINVAASPDGTAIADCRFNSTSDGANCFVDLFNCSDGHGVSSALPAQNYLTWVAITDHSVTTTYAESTKDFVDITNADMSFDTQILVDGGYFLLRWSLQGEQSGAPLSCSQTAAATAAGGSLETTATISGTSTALSDKFNCEDHFGYSDPLPSANYTITVDALNSADQALSTNPTTIQSAIGTMPNDIVDLGHVIIPIAGQ